MERPAAFYADAGVECHGLRVGRRREADVKHFRRSLVLVAVFSLAAAAEEAAAPPVIGARSYVNGTARLLVTGSISINEVVALNAKASLSDGEMTWLQFGESGAETPNALVTVSPYEVGVTVARGKALATAGGESCTGRMVVNANAVRGRYRCAGITSHDPASVALGKVDIEIDFTAGS
jgi:hypothetical protein